MSTYFERFIENPKSVIQWLATQLQSGVFGQVDFITGIGMSGSLPLIPVSMETGIKYVVCRKENESTHSCSNLFGNTKGYHGQDRRFVIIDDFMETGKTIKEVLSRFRSQCAGLLLYQQGESYHTSCLREFPHLTIVSSHDYSDNDFVYVGKKIEEPVLV